MLIPIETFLHRVFPPASYPEDGAQLARERLFWPRRGAPMAKLESPVDWEAEDNPDRNWRMQLQGWTMFHPIMNVFDGLKDKTSAIDYFFDVASEWWQRHGDDPEDIVTGRTPESYAWYDMSVGFRALVIAFFRNRITHFEMEISIRQTELLEALAMKHANHLRNPDVFFPNNHGIFQMHGLRAIAEVFEYSRAASDGDYAENTILRLLDLQFDSAGVHLEHSPHYHIYALRMFRSIEVSGWYINVPDLGARLSLAMTVVPWLVDPLKRPAAIGDSIPTTQEELAWPESGKAGSLILSEFNSSGYAVARSNWSTDPRQSTYLILSGGYHSKSHKHRDCLSFEWFESGVKRITDSGKYGYFADDKRRYVLSSRAHNSVEIEGLDILKMRPYGSAIRDSEIRSDGVYHATGALEFKAIQHQRDLYMKRGSWVLLRDALSYNRERIATQWFHPALGHELVGLSRAKATCSGPDGLDLIILCLASDTQIQIHFGDTEANQGFVSENDDHIEPGFAVGFRSQAQNTEITSVLALGDDSARDATRFAVRELGVSLREDRGFTSQLNGLEITDAIGVRAVHLHSGENGYRLTVPNTEIQFAARVVEGEPLTVILDSVSRSVQEARSTLESPDLQDVEGTVLVICDPVVTRFPTVKRGWFLGSDASDDLWLIRQLVERTQDDLQVPASRTRIVGWGPAAFAALKLGELLTDERIIAGCPELPTDDPSLDDTLAITHTGWTPDQWRLVYERTSRLSQTSFQRYGDVTIILAKDREGRSAVHPVLAAHSDPAAIIEAQSETEATALYRSHLAQQADNVQI